MPDFINELLSEVSGEEGPPTPSLGTAGEGEEVETLVVPAVAPSIRSPSPASLARREIGTAKVKRDRLKRLSQRHKLIIGMHLNGIPHVKIAEHVGCSRETIGLVIKDPLAQEVVTYYYEGVEEELKALFPRVVGAVREALDNASIDTKLKGVDRFAKLTGMGGEASGEKAISVSVVLDARTRFVNEIKEEARKMIDVEVEEVEDATSS
jgi:hypothetical protein